MTQPKDFLLDIINEHEQIGQADLLRLVADKGISQQNSVDALNALLKEKLVKFSKVGGQGVFSKINKSQIPNGIRLKENETNVYEHLRRCGEAGASPADVSFSLGLKKTESKTIMDSLVDLKLVCKNPFRKRGNLYMLVEFAKEEDLYYKGGKIDIQLVHTIMKQLMWYLGRNNEADVELLTQYINSTGVVGASKIDVAHVQSAVDTLVQARLIDFFRNRVKDSKTYFVINTMNDIEQFPTYHSSPCMYCPVAGECSPDASATICPQKCEYLTRWSER